MKLQQIRDELGDCQRCRLYTIRKHIVFGSGPDDAKWVFLGEAPGKTEDFQGLPFVGRSGKLLNELLEELGWQRNQVAVLNTVMCWPGPGNPDPAPDEKTACRPFLLKKLAAIKPAVITPLGRHAASSILGRPVSMGEVRGRVFSFMGAQVVPTYHPSYVLRGAAGAREQMYEDLLLAISILAEKGYGPPSL